MNQQLTKGKIGKQLTKLTIPMIWGVLAVIAFSVADTYFVGQLGAQPLAAMSFTFPVVMTLGNLAMGLGIGASSVIARAIGEGDRQRVRRLTTDSLTLSVLIVVIFVSLGLVTINPLFTALGATEETLPLVRTYMEIWYYGMIFLVIPMVGNSAIRASGNTKVPSMIMITAGLINILLDPLFIFGWGVFPGLGIKGAAIATVISRAVTLVTALWFLQKGDMLCYNLPPWQRVVHSWKQILHVGLPAAAASMITPISIAVITSFIAVYGAESVAAFGIASKVEAFALIVPLALSAVIGPFVGQNWGAQKYSRVKEALRLSFLFCLFWGVLGAVILAASGSWLASLFNDNVEVVAIASGYFLIVPISYGAAALIQIVSSTFNALAKPLPSTMITFTRMLFLYVPLAYVGGRLLGINGIFIAGCVANLIMGIVAFIWTQKICGDGKVKTTEEAVLLNRRQITGNRKQVIGNR